MTDKSCEITLNSSVKLLTAHQAFIRIEPLVLMEDAEARLVHIQSDEEITHEGDSDEWTLVFLLPNQQSECRCRIYRGSRSFRRVLQPIILKAKFTPYIIPPHLLEEAGYTLDDMWQNRLSSRPALPIPFRDSPEAVAALAEQGADFIAGSTSIVLSTEVLPSSEVVWKVYTFGLTRYETPFNKV